MKSIARIDPEGAGPAATNFASGARSASRRRTYGRAGPAGFGGTTPPQVGIAVFKVVI
jgi:hypothetical protein